MFQFRDFSCLLLILPILLLTLLIPASAALAQDDTMCVMCHKRPGLTGERDGSEISMFVDPAAHAGSAHQTVGCSGCHADADPEDLPHEDDLAPVDCGRCHEVQAADHQRSLHGQAGISGRDSWIPSRSGRKGLPVSSGSLHSALG